MFGANARTGPAWSSSKQFSNASRSMINLPGVLSAALEVEHFCKAHAWRFCFIGGISVQRWGQPRLTQDVDLTLMTGFGHEEQFVDKLMETFPGRRSDAREFALSRRVLLART